MTSEKLSRYLLGASLVFMLLSMILTSPESRAIKRLETLNYYEELSK